MRLVSVCVSLVIALTGSLRTQQPADTVQPQSQPRFYVAGGFELARFTRFPGPYASLGPGVGLSLQSGYTRQFERLGLRLGLSYFERDREYGPSFFGNFSELYHVSTSRTVAANVDLTYDLTRSRIRPYLIGGLAPYWTSVSQRYDSGRKVDQNHFGVALSPGLGLRVPLRHAEIFTEARIYLFSGHSYVFSPLTFGIRF
jgi:outer membrane protein with beta-barrel domain